MELLFNKTGNGSSEIKEILGFTDSDIKFEKLKPTIIPATDEVIKIIGLPIYQSLVDIYESNSSTDTELEFLNRVQYAILLDAYRNFAIENDLGHTANGRVNRVEDKQKLPWEWQIERDNRSLERKYYKSVDAMINFMDKSISAWRASAAYVESHKCFIRTATDFDTIFNIEGSRLLFMKLLPGIKKAERENIIPRIGKTKFDDLKTKLIENSSDVDTVLLGKIQEAIVFKALSWGVTRLSAQLFPEGLLLVADTSRLSTAARKSVENNEASAQAQRFKKDADDALLELEDYVKVPELPNADLPSIRPNFNANDQFVDT